jgi:hypothetical protein
MARVRSTTCPRDAFSYAGGEGAATERKASSECHRSGDSTKRTVSIQLSDVALTAEPELTLMWAHALGTITSGPRQ